MIVSSPLPRGKQPKFHESSPLQSYRENDATGRQWIRNKTSNFNSGGSDRQMAFLLQKLGRVRRRVVGGGASSTTGMVFMGEYGGGSYDTQQVVVFTPTGGAAGMYIALQPVPSGQSPDTGAPYWFSFPAPAPGMWGV